MGRILSLLIGLPLSIVAVALAVANRKSVTLSLDPFSPDAPALSVTLPLFALVFAALILGVLAGGIVVWARQGRFRRAAREARRELKRVTPAQQPSSTALGLPAPRG
ncbi:lipopolysaccharide assembly protein LapA domain-containing protein [Xanthobacter autotrophicus]|uniref:lipopolysaccharide assembly protein LapA domain-containing protein n=1 Tax=Xanthobacter autotrophicus TaxID=280 RepID=UPI0024A74D6F|nr:lipopolysaccharide assembly protein LapA domain-containing protein [Xanthobacter autotrophicus]MDI4658279.1 lipopolysaccharide assembly protein LapA domain-containing protein [Xanthobacter autotrophicus]